MGFDTSFHPLADTLIAERILPWVLGATDALDDLLDDAVRVAQVRFRANAWGLGATRVECDAFDSMLHVWGRPFLVTASDAAGRAQQIDAFLAATPADADDLARAHLDALEPGLSSRVTPATDGQLPPPEALRELLGAHLGLMRDAIRCLHDGTPTLTVGDQEHPVDQLLGRELARIVLDFSANFRPGWMSRGPTWPTHVLHEAPVRDAFVPNISLIQPVVEAFPDVPWQMSDSIHENYMVGGCLPTAQLQAAIDAVEPAGDVERQKLVEALQDALHRGIPFAEATEIYSGPMGIMN